MVVKHIYLHLLLILPNLANLPLAPLGGLHCFIVTVLDNVEHPAVLNCFLVLPEKNFGLEYICVVQSCTFFSNFWLRRCLLYLTLFHPVRASAFFFPLLCVYCLDIRAEFDSFLNKCLERCESFNDWIERGIKEQLEILQCSGYSYTAEVHSSCLIWKLPSQFYPYLGITGDWAFSRPYLQNNVTIWDLFEYAAVKGIL